MNRPGYVIKTIIKCPIFEIEAFQVYQLKDSLF